MLENPCFEEWREGMARTKHQQRRSWLKCCSVEGMRRMCVGHWIEKKKNKEKKMAGLVLYYHYSGSFLPAGLGLLKMVVKEMCEGLNDNTQRPQWIGFVVTWSVEADSGYGIGVLKVKGENGITELALRALNVLSETQFCCCFCFLLFFPKSNKPTTNTLYPFWQ